MQLWEEITRPLLEYGISAPEYRRVKFENIKRDGDLCNINLYYIVITCMNQDQ